MSWIGVDLDGTLAVHSGKVGPVTDIQSIGKAIQPVLLLVRSLLAQGKAVKIFTARANVPEQVGAIREWLVANGLPGDLEITATKDYQMEFCIDDRSITVEMNTGKILTKGAEWMTEVD